MTADNRMKIYWTNLGLLLVAIIGYYSTNSSAHEGKSHQAQAHKKPTEIIVGEQSTLMFKKIKREFDVNVRPIFRSKCYDCHGQVDSLPWYHRVPGVAQLIDSDITEAKEHLDMTNGFPFGGHGSPAEDLTSLGKTLANDSMPPVRYKLIHWKSGLTNREKVIVHAWIEQSLNELKKSRENETFQ